LRKRTVEKVSLYAFPGIPNTQLKRLTLTIKEGYWIVQSDEDALEWWLKSADMICGGDGEH
jgi:hypothetical protein